MSKRILKAVREASISIASCLDEPSEVTKKDLFRRVRGNKK